eukprot:7331251-Lingulodinium_polyedra.AAC.1
MDARLKLRSNWRNLRAHLNHAPVKHRPSCAGGADRAAAHKQQPPRGNAADDGSVTMGGGMPP